MDTKAKQTKERKAGAKKDGAVKRAKAVKRPYKKIPQDKLAGFVEVFTARLKKSTEKLDVATKRMDAAKKKADFHKAKLDGYERETGHRAAGEGGSATEGPEEGSQEE